MSLANIRLEYRKPIRTEQRSMREVIEETYQIEVKNVCRAYFPEIMARSKR